MTLTTHFKLRCALCLLARAGHAAVVGPQRVQVPEAINTFNMRNYSHVSRDGGNNFIAKLPPVRRSLLRFSSSSSRWSCGTEAVTDERGCLKLDSAKENSESPERRRRREEESPS